MYIKRVFPWGCSSGFLRRIVPDAAPQHGLTNGIPHIERQRRATASSNAATAGPSDEAELSSTEKELQKLMNNNHQQVTPMLVKRTQSIGERVL